MLNYSFVPAGTFVAEFKTVFLSCCFWTPADENANIFKSWKNQSVTKPWEYFGRTYWKGNINKE